MLELAHPDAGSARAEEKRIDVAKRELLTFIGSLDDKAAFNIVFFHHKLVPYESAPVVATAAARARATDFVTPLEPIGGTNIYDALETAFKMSNAATADGKDYKTVYDTIFFLTDGTPTAGKVQDPDKILAAVTEWNRTARIVVHVIGVGDSCDEKFLKALASQNGGQFRLR
jgi:Ca-activated chloride channel family protein